MTAPESERARLRADSHMAVIATGDPQRHKSTNFPIRICFRKNEQSSFFQIMHPVSVKHKNVTSMQSLSSDMSDETDKTTNFLDTAEAWAEEHNRKIANGEDPWDGTPEPRTYTPAPDNSWRRHIELICEAIDLQRPIMESRYNAFDKHTWVNMHRAYYYLLTAERRRLVEGVLKGIDLGIED
ncbi:hypothetical protein [Paraburkholderia sp. Cpub6]|uniref:hypothetical protein n=1 Tax=Paraburkholderia sp. Cpub6 TaxID=2723094 RepID=UPI001619E3C6|nr:hypothetical protein [Paraburkholderia sp. Cpub6]MBB5460241.1 hypothetical protein [Paraburkholderia sp. Cpub6]